MSFTKLELCSNASLRTGNNPITSLENKNAISKFCNQIYDGIYEAMLESNYWTFATKRTQLSKNAIKPEFEYDNEFFLPTDFLRFKKFLTSSSTSSVTEPVKYDFVQNKRIQCNDDAIAIEYIAIVNESNLTATFAEAMELTLASKIALAINEDRAASRDFEVLAQQKLKEAKYLDGTHERPVDVFRSRYDAIKNGGR